MKHYAYKTGYFWRELDNVLIRRMNQMIKMDNKNKLEI